MKMTYEEAVQAYFDAHEKVHGHTHGLYQPREIDSEMETTGRWILRNVNGFLAYVTSTGKVLDQHFQTIGE